MEWQQELLNAQRAARPLIMPEGPLPGAGRVLALAPHPDDPDAVAVILRMLVQGGWEMHWAILTSSWSGVEDDFVGPSPLAKTRVRQEEQRAAARLFGLPEARLTFLNLTEGADGHLLSCADNHLRYTAYLSAVSPDIVVLPCLADTNPTHRLNYAWFAAWAATHGRPVLALGNEDPKTTAFTPDFSILFGEETAVWKGALLECHRSQSVRNQHTRQMTFAERILRVNADSPGLAPGQYAERFQVARWG